MTECLSAYMMLFESLESRRNLSVYFVDVGQSIDAAVDAAKPGDEIVVRPGVYHESITISRSGQAGNPIVLRAETPGTVTIDASGNSTVLIASGGRYISITGLTLSGANNLEGNHNAAVRTGDNWVMQDCVIEDNAGGGMGIYGANVVVRR